MNDQMEEAATTRTPARRECSLLNLPESQLGEVLGHLPLKEQRFLLGTCKPLWHLRISLDSKVQELCIDQQDTSVLPPPTSDTSPDMSMLNSRQLFWSHFNRGLRRLDLGEFCTDAFLIFIAEQELLENLQSISMGRSLGVTDEGLRYLCMGEARAKNLVRVDITYCRNTTYQGTFPLRDRLENLQLIRRQPEWMDGMFYTPFGGASNQLEPEVHTYWPDGSFSFNRDTQSRGFICDLFEWKEKSDHVFSKLQYNNSIEPEGGLQWIQSIYRPGVSLYRLPEETRNGQSIRSVLVLQRVNLLQTFMLRNPPHDLPLMERAASIVPLGQSRYFDIRGELLSDEAEEEERFTMVSRMRVVAIPVEEGHMPPKELVDRNREVSN